VNSRPGTPHPAQGTRKGLRLDDRFRVLPSPKQTCCFRPAPVTAAERPFRSPAELIGLPERRHRRPSNMILCEEKRDRSELAGRRSDPPSRQQRAGPCRRLPNCVSFYRHALVEELDAAIIVQPDFALPKSCGCRLMREELLAVLAPGTRRGAAPQAPIPGGRLADRSLRETHLFPRERYELDALDAIAVLVDQGSGVSLVLDWAPPWPAGIDVAKLALPRPFPHRRIGGLWRRSTAGTRLVKAATCASLAEARCPTCARHSLQPDAPAAAEESRPPQERSRSPCRGPGPHRLFVPPGRLLPEMLQVSFGFHHLLPEVVA
jgi:hypothetical protein